MGFHIFDILCARPSKAMQKLQSHRTRFPKCNPSILFLAFSFLKDPWECSSCHAPGRLKPRARVTQPWSHSEFPGIIQTRASLHNSCAVHKCARTCDIFLGAPFLLSLSLWPLPFGSCPCGQSGCPVLGARREGKKGVRVSRLKLLTADIAHGKASLQHNPTEEEGLHHSSSRRMRKSWQISLNPHERLCAGCPMQRGSCINLAQPQPPGDSFILSSIHSPDSPAEHPARCSYL